MPKWGQRIFDLRAAKGWSQAKLAQQAGVSLARAGAAERAQNPNEIGSGVRAKIAAALGVTHERLVEGFAITPAKPRGLMALKNQITKIERDGASEAFLESIGAGKRAEDGRPRRIPGGDDIAAGKPISDIPDPSPDDPSQFIPGELFPWDDSAFFVRVSGHSMYPDFHDGDLVIGSPALRDQVEPGDRVCVRFTVESRFKGGRTLKRIRWIDDGKYILESLNPQVEPIGEVSESEIDALGPVVVHIRHIWKREGYSVQDLMPARKDAKPVQPKASDDVVQPFPDYDGPQKGEKKKRGKK